MYGVWLEIINRDNSIISTPLGIFSNLEEAKRDATKHISDLDVDDGEKICVYESGVTSPRLVIALDENIAKEGGMYSICYETITEYGSVPNGDVIYVSDLDVAKEIAHFDGVLLDYGEEICVYEYDNGGIKYEVGCGGVIWNED